MQYILVIDQIAYGGAERILIDYYHYLINKGNKVVIFALFDNGTNSEWKDSLNIIYGVNKNYDNLIIKTYHQICLYFKLKKITNSICPDIIFSFLEKSNLLTILMPLKAIKVATVHNILSIQYNKVRSSIVRKVLYKIINLAYNHCNNIIAVSEQVKNDLITSFGVRSSNIKVINNCVDRNDIFKKASFEISDFNFDKNKRYVINVGRFSTQKAQWKLIKSFFLLNTQFENCSDVELILMGEGEYFSKLKKLALELSISDKINFISFNVNPYKYMAKSNLLVLPSLFEGFPIVLSEISSLRIPFVGADKAIPKEMFKDENFWYECTFTSGNLDTDFSITINSDEKKLANLIYKGLNDAKFRKELLIQTEQWEKSNDKLIQFALYSDYK